MLIYYVQTNLICIILLAGVLIMAHHRKGFNPASQRAFSMMVIATILLCISDTFAWLLNGNPKPGVDFFLELSNIVYFISITWVSYCWLEYVNITIRGITYGKKQMFLALIPLLVIIIVVMTTPFTHFMFSIGENNEYARGNGIILHWIVSWGYLIYAMVKIFLESRRAATVAEKKQLAMMLRFIIAPSVGAAVQMLVYGVTGTGCGITLSILMLSYSNIQEQVFTDALTGLNNRRSLVKYAEGRIQPDGTWFSVLMCDIDKFKSINDNYGHLTGDLALKRMATVLKTVVGKSGSGFFLCRYGGDEFVICGTNIVDDNTIQDLVSSIHAELSRGTSDYPRELLFTISIGVAEDICRSYDDVDRLIHRADEAMYSRKQEKNITR